MQHYQHIGVFCNPFSKGSHFKQIVDCIADSLTKKGISFHVLKDWPITVKDFTECWIVGGDGTLNFFINKYPDCKLPIAIFKGGTGNDFATRLYGNCTTEQQIEILLKATPQYVDAALCNEKIYINSLGIGFDGTVLKNMKAIRAFGSHLGYLAVVLKNIFVYKEKAFNILYGDKSLHKKYLLVIINNNSTTGGGFLVTPLAAINDGYLDLLLAEPLSIFNRLLSLPLIEKGTHLSKLFIQYTSISAITVTCEQPVFAALDGELIESPIFNIKVLPKKFLFKY